MRVALALAVVIAAGCPDPRRCQTGFIGDPKLPVEIQMLFTDGVSQVLMPVQPGQSLPLEPPPQGGYVMYVGAQARNLDACGVELRGSLRDPTTGDEVGFDARTTDLVLGSDGWGRPDPSNNSNVSNVNGCPDYTAQDIQGRPYVMRMTVVDREHRQGVVSVPVVPSCGFAGALQYDCVCTCSANYELGACAPPDGGQSG